MDLLQRELERKKQTLAKAREEAGAGDDDNGGGSRSNKSRKRKFIRQKDLRRLEEEQQQEETAKRLQEEALKKKKQKKESEKPIEASTNPTDAAAKKKKKKNKKGRDRSTEASKTTTKNLGGEESSSNDNTTQKQQRTSASTTTTTTTTTRSKEDVTQQLRNLGLPVRYFGEIEIQRIERLELAIEKQQQALLGLSEKEEFALGKGHGIRNTFLDRDNNNDRNNDLHHGLGFGGGAGGGEDSKKQKKKKADGDDDGNDKKGKDGSKNQNDGKEDEDDDINGEKDPPKFIYKFLKGLLKEWENDLSLRPDIDARSVQGRNETKTLKQCKDYIRPLFKLLKNRNLELGMQSHLVKIVQFAKQGEFVKAHDTYMDLAIGRAAWPIGVTMVGIHARTGRAKIESSNVAHVMNSELQRKYLTSVKRLLSYAQKKRPDVDPSKKVS